MEIIRRYTAPAELRDHQPYVASQTQPDIWKEGYEIPSLPRRAGTWNVLGFGRSDQREKERRYQDVEKLLEEFKGQLDAMRGGDNRKALDNLLPSDQRERFKSRINHLAGEFIERSKNAVKDEYEFRQLDELYKRLEEIHKNFSQTAKTWLSIYAKLTSIREVQDNLRVRGHLPQGQEGMLKDFVERFQQAIKGHPDISILPTPNQKEELTQLHDVLVEMHDDLYKAKDMWGKIDAKLTSIREVQYNLRVRGHLPQGQEGMLKDFVKRFQEAINLSESAQEGELKELHDVLVEVHDDLYRAKYMCDKLDEIKSYRFVFPLKGKNKIDNDIHVISEYIKEAGDIALSGYKKNRQESKKIRDKAWKEANNVIKWLDDTIKFIHEIYLSSIQQITKTCQQQFEEKLPQFVESQRRDSSSEELDVFLVRLAGSIYQDIKRADMSRNSLTRAMEQNRVVASQDLTLCHEEALRLRQKVLTMRIMMLSGGNPGTYQALSGLLNRTDKLMNEAFDGFATSKLPEQDKQKHRHECALSFDSVYGSIAQAVETFESSGKGSDAISQAEKQFAQLKQYLYQMKELDRIKQKITVWQDWFDKNCPVSNIEVENDSNSEASRLQSIRSKFQRASARADRLANRIARQAKSGDVVPQLRELALYEGNFFTQALELIQASPEVSSHHKDELTALVQQGGHAAEEASNILAKEEDRDLQECDKFAFQSVNDVVRRCGPKENLEEIDSFIESAKKEAFNLRYHILRHTKTDIYERISTLREQYAEIHRNIEKFVGNDEILKQNLADNDRLFFASLMQMGDSREQMSAAIDNAGAFLDKLNKMYIKSDYEYINTRINEFSKWYQNFYRRIADSRLYVSSDVQPRRDMLYSLKLAQGIEENFQQSSHEQETALQQYAEVCHKMEASVINLYLAANSGGTTRQSVRSLVEKLDQAYDSYDSIEGNHAFSQTDRQEAHAFYTQAYSIIADGIIKFDLQQFFGLDEPDSQFIVEAKTQLDMLNKQLERLSSAQEVDQTPRKEATTDRPSSRTGLQHSEEQPSRKLSSEVGREEVAPPDTKQDQEGRQSPDNLPIKPQEEVAPQDTGQHQEDQRPVLSVTPPGEISSSFQPEARQDTQSASRNTARDYPQTQVTSQEEPSPISPIVPPGEMPSSFQGGAGQDSQNTAERQEANQEGKDVISPITPQKETFSTFLDKTEYPAQPDSDQSQQYTAGDYLHTQVTPDMSSLQHKAEQDIQPDSDQSQQYTAGDYQRMQQRSKAREEWYTSVVEKYTRSDIQSFHGRFQFSFGRIKELGTEIEKGMKSGSDELEEYYKQYAETCHKIEETVIDLYLAVNSAKETKESVRSLRHELDQAYRPIRYNEALTPTDQQNAYTLYTQAYSVIADGLTNENQQQFFDSDAPNSEFLVRAKKELGRLKLFSDMQEDPEDGFDLNQLGNLVL